MTGSNSVNVFLGIGLPWLLASFYWHLQGTTFAVRSQGMSFSVLAGGLYLKAFPRQLDTARSLPAAPV